MCVLVFANIVRLCPLFDGVTGVAPRFWGYQTLTLIFKKIFKKNDKKGTLPPSPPAGSCKSLFLFNPNDNDSYLLFTNFTKKNFDIRVYPNKKRFSGNLQKFGLGHGATEPHPDRTQIGVSPFKKAPYSALWHIISHYETHSRIDNDSHSHLGSAPKRRRK